MAVYTFLGEPPANIKKWIIDYIESSKTIVTYNDGSKSKFNISKSISSSQIDNIQNAVEINIGQTVTEIAPFAFRNCSNLIKVTLPNTITTIGDGAFVSCTGFTDIILPDSVTLIGNEAFKNCSAIKSIEIPDSVINIGSEAFRNCSSLTSLTIGNNVTTIGSNAFSGCNALITLNIGNGLTDIYNISFSEHRNLEYISFGYKLKYLPEYCFIDLDKLIEITFKSFTCKYVIENTSIWAIGLSSNGNTHPVIVYCKDGIVIINGNINFNSEQTELTIT